MRRAPTTLRARVALATALVLSAVLASVALVVDAAVGTHAQRTLDEALHLEGEALAALVRLEDGHLEVDTDGEQVLEGYAVARGGAYYEIWARGQAPLRSPSLAGTALPAPDLVSLEPGAARRAERQTTLAGPFEARVRLVERVVERFVGEEQEEPRAPGARTEPVLVRVARTTAALDAHQGSVRTALAWAAPLGLLLGTLAAWWLAGRAMAPIARLAAQADAVGRGASGTRLDDEGVEGELRRLARTLNDAFARLEAQGERERRFAADASHELRTPLAVVRTHLELALSRERQPAEYRRALAEALEGALRLEAVVRQLLLLARVEAGGLALQPLDVSEPVRRAVAAAEQAAEPGAAPIRLRTPPEALPVAGDAVLLERLVGNLLENVRQHAGASPVIEVEVERAGPEVRIAVLDRGPGLPADLGPRLFERFARGDASRARATGGAGLGLSIVRAIARAHGGEASAGPREHGGTRLEVRLPLAPPERTAPPAS